MTPFDVLAWVLAAVGILFVAVVGIGFLAAVVVGIVRGLRERRRL